MSKERIGKVVLDLDLYPGEDFYSEGASEDELLEAVKNNKPEEFNRLIKEKNTWSFLYHLSHLRGNIVEWMDVIDNAQVLEIGSGCGAITGVLAQKAKNVTCVELSKKRSMINAYRNKEKENITIKVGNFEAVEKTLDSRYDVITLIGVFEYAASYINHKDPYIQFLNIVKKHLKPGGSIIIAIENKYGMKYWAGCKEDHAGRYFEGIEGYPYTEGVRTFSKTELEQLFKKCGFGDCKFYYPYPDYKLPVAVYSDDYLPKEGELQMNMRNFDGDRVELFEESRAFDTVIKDNMFPFFSNSYLVVLKKEEEC